IPAFRASTEGSTAGHTAARLMQPDTAMAHITAIALRTIPATTRRAAVLEPIPYAPTRLPIPHPATAITCHPLRPYSPTIPECLEPRTARTGPARSAMHTACTSAATWCAPIIGEIARSQVDHRGSVTDHVAAWQRVADRHVQRRGVVAEPVSLPWPSRNSVLPSRCRSAVPIMRPLRSRNVVTLPLVEAPTGRAS